MATLNKQMEALIAKRPMYATPNALTSQAAIDISNRNQGLAGASKELATQQFNRGVASGIYGSSTQNQGLRALSGLWGGVGNNALQMGVADEQARMQNQAIARNASSALTEDARMKFQDQLAANEDQFNFLKMKKENRARTLGAIMGGVASIAGAGMGAGGFLTNLGKKNT